MVVCLQTPTEHEAEMGIKSKEARKYIFNCLDDMMQVTRELFVSNSAPEHARQTLTSCPPAGKHDKPGGHRHPGREG